VSVAAGCGGGQAKVAPSPLAAVAAQVADLPKGFTRCSFSGEVESYLASFDRVRSPGYAEIADEWTQLKEAGATAVYFSVLGSPKSACADVLTGSMDEQNPRPHIQTVFNYIVTFVDAEAAVDAYHDGLFSGPDLKHAEGATVVDGPATGLGPNAAVTTLPRPPEAMGDRRDIEIPVRGASWQTGPYGAFFGSEGVGPQAAAEANLAVGGRIQAFPPPPEPDPVVRTAAHYSAMMAAFNRKSAPLEGHAETQLKAGAMDAFKADAAALAVLADTLVTKYRQLSFPDPMAADGRAGLDTLVAERDAYRRLADVANVDEATGLRTQLTTHKADVTQVTTALRRDLGLPPSPLPPAP